MAAAVGLRAAFVRIGFTNEAADALTDAAQENITLDSLAGFQDQDVKALCKALRKPGGTIDGPAPAGGGAVQQVANPGVAVSAMAELNLKITCFLAQHFIRVSRTLTTPDITAAAMIRYDVYRRSENEFKEPDTLLKLQKPEKVIDWLEEFEEHLYLYNGQNGRPLSYVIREDPAVSAEVNDPAYGANNTVYTSLREEIYKRAPHTDVQYQLDSARVFELVNGAVSEHKHIKTWIKPFVAAQDGRRAWLALKAHYLGAAEMEAIEVAAEKRLDQLIYRGEKPRYTFELHVSFHRKAHLDIEKTTGNAIPEPTKVRRLIKSIQTDFLKVPLATIRAQDNLKNDFDSACNYLRNYINTNVDVDQRNISTLTSQTSGRSGKGTSDQHTGKRSNERRRNARTGTKGKSGKSNDGKNQKGDSSADKSLDRYYKPEEWWKLSPDKREKIVALRKKRNVSEINRSESEASDDDQKPPAASTTTQRNVRPPRTA
jgi:hypothetical protein